MITRIAQLMGIAGSFISGLINDLIQGEVAVFSCLGFAWVLSAPPARFTGTTNDGITNPKAMDDSLAAGGCNPGFRKMCEAENVLLILCSLRLARWLSYDADAANRHYAVAQICRA